MKIINDICLIFLILYLIINATLTRIYLKRICDKMNEIIYNIGGEPNDNT